MEKKPKIKYVFLTSNGVESISEELYNTIVNDAQFAILRQYNKMPNISRDDERKLYEAYKVLDKIVNKRPQNDNKN